MKKIVILFLSLCSMASAQVAGQWTWMHGSNLGGGLGNYGTKGVPGPTVEPPGIYEGCEWTDQNYNFWVFGGVGTNGENGGLFKYDLSINQWTWMSGTNTANAAGVYGTLGVPSALNMPGARGWGAMTWADKLGNLWLYGGYGYDAIGTYGELADLWKYTIATNEWTWMAGPNSANPAGVYGTLGVPAAANYPPPRSENNTAWTDSQNNLWLYGGMSSNTFGTYADMWKFDVSVNQWVWMDGTQTQNVAVNFGTQGVEAPANTPGGRFSYTKFVDSQNNLYFFGAGTQYTSSLYSDVWRYNITTQNWAWIGGSQTVNHPGTYTAHCDTVTPNIPTSKFEIRASWPDSCGFFFMGGFGAGEYNDLWYYSIDNNKFTWVSGSSTAGAPGVWGTQGVPAAANVPSSRGGALSFFDNQGNLWYFGGMDFLGNRYSDLWRYTPDPTCVPLCASSIFNTGLSASFTGGGNGCPPMTVSFNNSFSNGTTYFWDFGDGSTSTQQDPSHTYTQSGVYTVSLIVTDTSGSDTVVHVNAVSVGSIPTASFTSSQDSICAGQSIAFASTSTSNGGIGSYNWNFDNGTFSSLSSVNVTYNTSGQYDVSLIVSDTSGSCTDTIVQSVIVIPNPVMLMTASPQNGCEDLTVNFSSAASTSYTSLGWNFGDGNTSSTASPQHIYTNSGTYTVTLSGFNSLGCADTVQATVNVLPAAQASFTANPLSGCMPLTVNLFNTSSGYSSVSWLWYQNGATSVNDSVFPVICAEPGTDTVTLIAFAANGCHDTITGTITTNELCESIFIPNVFTPNGDGNNETFLVKVEGYTNYNIIIFDRWGLKMFESSDVLSPWNGSKMNSGGKCPDGTYYYLITVTSKTGEVKNFSGHMGVYR